MRSVPIRDSAVSTQRRRIRLLIVDDSAVARAVLRTIFERDDDFEVIACVDRAEQALAVLTLHRIDIVLLDLEMPGIDGLTALPAIVERGRGAKVVILSAACGEGAQASVRALALGAVDSLAKPTAVNMSARFATALRKRLLRIGHAGRGEGPAAGNASAASPPAPIACLALGASTGGVNALIELIGELLPHFTAPILITQHLPAAFIEPFAGQLSEAGSRETIIARDGAPLVRGTIHLAPGTAHMRVAHGPTGLHLRLDRRSVASRCVPSVDPMLASVGEVFGAAGVGVMLSGMGRDGLAGAAALVAAGGTMMVQDRDSAVVWGMPGAVVDAKLASEILPPAGIARRLLERGAAA